MRTPASLKWRLHHAAAGLAAGRLLHVFADVHDRRARDPPALPNRQFLSLHVRVVLDALLAALAAADGPHRRIDGRKGRRADAESWTRKDAIEFAEFGYPPRAQQRDRSCRVYGQLPGADGHDGRLSADLICTGSASAARREASLEPCAAALDARSVHRFGNLQQFELF